MKQIFTLFCVLNVLAVHAWAGMPCPPNTVSVMGPLNTQACKRLDSGAYEVYLTSSETCPIGYHATNVHDDLKVCAYQVALSGGDRTSRLVCGPGTVPIIDQHGNKLCRRDYRIPADQDYINSAAYKEGKSCPLGSYPVTETDGSKACQLR